MAEVLGVEHDEALTLRWAVAGLNAYSTGVSLGLFQPTPREVKELTGKAYALYEKFRPEIPPGKKGWGPPASWTWTSSERCLRPDPEARLFGRRSSGFDAAKAAEAGSLYSTKVT